MKKLLTGLMLATASFMLLFTVSTNEVHAVPHQEQFTLVKDPDFDYNLDLYNFLQYAYANYDDGVHPELLVDIDVLTYSTSSVSKASGVFTLTFDTYVIVVDGTTITSTGAAISDGTYVLDFYLEYETYQDLFYDEYILEFEIVTFSNGIGTTDVDVYDWISENITFNEFGGFNNPNFSLTVNNIEEVSDIYIYEGYYAIGGGDYNAIIKPNSVIEDDGSPEPINVGDVWRYTLRVNKTWTQAHDYGRIRTNTSTLYLNQPSETAVFLSHSESTNVINVSNIAVGDEIVMQSPYSDFSVSYGNIGFPRTYLVEQENIAAVKMIKNSSDNTDYTFVLYYWEDGGIVSRVVSNVNLANRNSLNIKFDGGFRKALDNQDVMVANVDNLTALEDFLPYLTAFDAIDGDISDQIVILDDGGYAPDVVGTYNVQFGVTNSNGLETTLIIPVHVVDIVAPVITGVNTPVQIGYHQEFNVAAWVASLTVTDNYYTGLTITVQTNTYSSNKTTIGTYEIVMRSVDPSGNVGTFTRVIEVVDGIGPVFTGIETITASINENLTVEQIQLGLAAIDAVDGNVTASITVDSDGLTGNATNPGVYEVIFMAVDLAGNQTFHTVTVTIVTSPPGFYILNSNSVRLLPGATLSIEQILNLLGAAEAQNISTNYNAAVAGVYNLSYTLNDVNYSIKVTVLGDDEPGIPMPELPEEPTIDLTYLYVIVGIVGVLSLGYLYFKKK